MCVCVCVGPHRVGKAHCSILLFIVDVIIHFPTRPRTRHHHRARRSHHFSLNKTGPSARVRAFASSYSLFDTFDHTQSVSVTHDKWRFYEISDMHAVCGYSREILELAMQTKLSLLFLAHHEWKSTRASGIFTFVSVLHFSFSVSNFPISAAAAPSPSSSSSSSSPASPQAYKS